MKHKPIEHPRCTKCGRETIRNKHGVFDCFMCGEWLFTMENENETTPIKTDDGYLCCDACGYEIHKGDHVCEHCKRRIDWEK